MAGKVVRNPQAGKKTGRTTLDIFKSIGSAALQGASFGTSDEIVSYIRSLGSEKTYEQLRDEARKNLADFRKTDPVKAYAAEIIGSIPSALIGGLGVGAALKGGALGGKLATQAGVAGGLEAGIYGAGASEGGAGDRIAAGLTSVPLGVAGGALGQKITPIASEAAKKLIKKGLPLTPGQYFGGKIASIEGKVSIPYLQETIGS